MVKVGSLKVKTDMKPFDSAFPTHPDSFSNNGLSKRELFAAMMLQGLCSINDERTCPKDMLHNVEGWRNQMYLQDAIQAVEYADSLILALSQNPQ